MDPIHRGPEDFGHDNDGYGEAGGRRTPSRTTGLSTDFGQQPQQARVVQVVAGDLLLTVNPVDGSEVEQCPPGELPPVPVRRTAAERTDRERAAAPPVPPGPPAPQLPLLERQEEREQLVRLLARGRSVRLTGPAGSGRTALLNAVAADCTDLAPDGVVRLSGCKRTVTDLLYGLFEAVHDAPLLHPDRAGLLERLRSVGAVVVLDDLEFGGAALDELLDATPECAFLFGTTPDAPAPGPDAHLEEVFLAGLGRSASITLLEKVVERPLTEEEANWAGDLWFESEGLPLRFVQAGALLRQRDLLRTDTTAYDEHGYFDGRPGDDVFVKGSASDGSDIPLPSLGEGAAPAALLASRLSGPARDTLHFAVALGGEVPHQAHLPALVGDTHADAALGELAGCGLLSPAGSRYRLAPGVVAQLEAAGYGEDADDRARTAAQHYAWWTGHPSVSPARAVAEADAIVAAMARLIPGEGAGQASAAVLLARSAAPAFAAGLHWGGWEKALRLGQEAARNAGEVAEEAYFHHELGVLALCNGNPDRARAELETSIGMRGALADKPGAVAGRRALALVEDRSGGHARAGEELLGRAVRGVTPARRYTRGRAHGAAAGRRGPDRADIPGRPGDRLRRVRRPQGGADRRPAQRGRGGRGRTAGRGARHGGDGLPDVRQRHPGRQGGLDRAVGGRGRRRERFSGRPAGGRLRAGRLPFERRALDAPPVRQPDHPERQRRTVHGVERAVRQPRSGQDDERKAQLPGHAQQVAEQIPDEGADQDADSDPDPDGDDRDAQPDGDGDDHARDLRLGERPLDDQRVRHASGAGRGLSAPPGRSGRPRTA